MKTLIVEDDLTSRIYLQELLDEYGTVHVAVNGEEAMEAVDSAADDGDPYDLICLDIMMPEVDGQEALRKIRDNEAERGISSTRGAKVVMTTALGNVSNVSEAYSNLCDAYLVKPIDKKDLIQTLRDLGLME
ncbi:MAG: response regulator [Planctomycetota bacterium]